MHISAGAYQQVSGDHTHLDVCPTLTAELLWRQREFSAGMDGGQQWERRQTCSSCDAELGVNACNTQ